jgi:aspartate aminotransferase
MENQMTKQSIHARHMSKVMEAMAGVQGFIDDSPWSRLREEPDVCDFALGNPHEDSLPGLSQAFQRWSVPENKDWFAYKMSEPASRELVAHSLRLRLGVQFEADDIFMTNGAFAAISVAVGTITDPGDEIIYVSPPWFFYAAIIVAQNGTPIRVPCDSQSFDLNLQAIRSAITPHTRAVIVNTPNNPTGRIYPPDTLKALAALLQEASAAAGRPIYLLSDESYSHLLFDGHAFHSPAEYYPNTFLIYTYGKTLLAPGERIGYIALPASMPFREQLRPVIFATQMVTGYAFPNALLQHALPDLENLTIDIERLQARRDHLVRALHKIGYRLNPPEATFYLLVRSPLEDDQAFIDILGEEKILCLPGSVFEMPGYFRISLTASDDMVERALPGFARAFTRAKVESKEILETNLHQ